MKNIPIHRSEVEFLPDCGRVLIRPFIPNNPEQIIKIIGRALALSENTTKKEVELILRDFGARHIKIETVLIKIYNQVKQHLFTDEPISFNRKLLIGALFTGEYALESAALFNPSIVPHPDQSGLPEHCERFIMSLRATGEGHISSIEFRVGTLFANGTIKVDSPTEYVTTPEIHLNPTYNKHSFLIKLHEMGFHNKYAESVLESLEASFTLDQLERSIRALSKQARGLSHDEQRTLECMRWLAESNYQLSFESQTQMSERILFPVSANESNGIEDARFVRFVDDDGSVIYYGTYTAYNGHVILPQLLETRDFLNFSVLTLNGSAAKNKGMALFPRRINGNYVMLSRQDDENLFLIYSDNPHYWNNPQKIIAPKHSWEMVKLGNCGSPLETESGWLVITHGVGPMRQYCIGALLLDLEDPSKIIGRLSQPLLKPEANEREGYVPNVVYTCGAMIHNGYLILPYAMSDRATVISTIPLEKLITALLN